MLQDPGYKRVAHLDGGTKAWQEAGMRLQQGTSTVGRLLSGASVR